MSDPIDVFLESESMTKQAAPFGKMMGAAKEGAGEFWPHAGKALAWGAGAVGTAIVGQAAMEAFDAAKGAVQKSRGFNKMMDQNPQLQKMDGNKVQAIYGTLHRFNPEMAQDPFVSGAWVKRINEYDYVDPRTIGELVSARGRVKAPVIDPMRVATGMADVGLRSREQQQQQQQRMAEVERSEGFQRGMYDKKRWDQHQDNRASDQFNWHKDQEKMRREDERMRERSYLEKNYYSPGGRDASANMPPGRGMGGLPIDPDPFGRGSAPAGMPTRPQDPPEKP